MIQAHKDPKLPKPVDIPDGPEWMGLLKQLSPETGETLVALVRTLCPHDGLPDRPYRRVVLAYDRLAGASNQWAGLIGEATAFLDKAWPLPFRDCAESYRVAALRAMEATPAFAFLQRAAMRFLYDDIEVWQAFGYEGAAFHLGGYVERGFDDLDWLPDLPEDFMGKEAAQ